MPFFLFVLATAALFLRPSELVPDLIGETTGVYEVAILVCLVVSLPRVLAQFRPATLAGSPVSLCAFGVLAAIGLSGVDHQGPAEARFWVVDFVKVLVYYLLLVGCLDSGPRLRAFLYWWNAFILAVVALALLQYHGLIDLPALAAAAQRQDADEETGEEGVILLRMCGPGIFDNPNDLARIIAVGMILCLYGFRDRQSPIPRYLWLVPFGGLGYAIVLTFSRGGLLALLAGLAVLAWHRLGARRAIAIGLLFVPVMLAAKGRQTDVSLDKGTGNERVHLWRDGLDALRETPVLGVGPGTYPQLTGGLLAHNSFVQAYTEIGFVGGTFFLGAFAAAVLSVRRVRPGADPQLAAARAYVLAIIVGYGVGMLSSSRTYWVITYLLFGLAAAWHRVATAAGAAPPLAVGPRQGARLVGLSAAVLSGFFVFVRVVLG
jgi:putative inorganic carbon (hco3(-)) transporter